MKKGISLLLCLLLLAGFYPGAAQADAEMLTPEETAQVSAGTSLEEATGAQAFAVTMAAWLADNPEELRLEDPLLLWDAAGWYAAWLYRTEGCDLLTMGETEDFLRSLGLEGEAELPEGWEEYGVVRVLRGRSGELSLDFVQHKLEIDEMLGVSTMVTTLESTEDTVTTLLSCFYEDGLSADWMYALRFARAEEGADFPYRLVSLALLDDGPKMDPALDFTWAELLRANRLETLLTDCPAVKIDDGLGTGATWLFEDGGELARVSVGESYTGGEFRGCYFEYEEGEDGVLRARIGHVDESAASRGFLDSYLTDYLNGVCIVSLQEDDGELLWLDCVYRGGYHQTVALNRGTLRLHEMDYYYDAEEAPLRTRFATGESAPDFPFLASWDGPMRTVTTVWESFPWSEESGEYERAEETLFTRIPADWEYLPYEARWGEYTAYLNAGYTESYAYPGDGVDYTLYLTTAKG